MKKKETQQKRCEYVKLIRTATLADLGEAISWFERRQISFPLISIYLKHYFQNVEDSCSFGMIDSKTKISSKFVDKIFNTL